jgi:hypothetical protein
MSEEEKASQGFYEDETDPSSYYNSRWKRRPVHEELETPLTPSPPITPTFGDEETNTEE